MSPSTFMNELNELISIFEKGFLTDSEFEDSKKILLKTKTEETTSIQKRKPIKKAKLSDLELRDFLKNLFEQQDIRIQHNLTENGWSKAEDKNGIIIKSINFKSWNGKKNTLMCEDPREPGNEITLSSLLKDALKRNTVRALDHLYFIDDDSKVRVKGYLKANGFDIN